MAWVEGRQGGGYLKWRLFRLWTLDCYLLKYPKGSGVKYHTDPVPGYRHFRLNIMLRKPVKGGHFRIRGYAIINWEFLKLFRPDIRPHAVEVVQEGERLVLSLGIAIP